MKTFKPHIDQTKKIISIRGLKKSFDDFHVLKGVDMDLYQGENLVVLGVRVRANLY
jgi:phospholipid/cholesterol/gamma-HCH transport system ATP-binding protein